MQVRPHEATQEPPLARGLVAPDEERHATADNGALHAVPRDTSRRGPTTSPSLFLPEPLWTPSLAQRARESICYSKPWLDLIERVYGYQTICLTTTGPDGRFTGVLPMCAVSGPLGGKHLVALPFSDLCPLLATDAASADGLIDQAIGLTHRQKARYLELHTGADGMLAGRADLIAQDQHVRYWVPLDGDPASLWRELAASVRTKVNRARRSGVQVRMASGREDMLHLYRLHLQTRSKKHGMPAQPKRFFLGLWDAFAAAGAIEVFLAEYEGQPIAVNVVLTTGQTAKWVYVASDERYLHLAPNHLLVWSVIEWTCIHGYRALDLGRTARDNSGLIEFKRRVGAVEEPLTYYYHPHVAGLTSTAESSWKYRALTACWKQLPLSVAASLGGRLYKYLA